jgi:hypothetical protein
LECTPSPITGPTPGSVPPGEIKKEEKRRMQGMKKVLGKRKNYIDGARKRKKQIQKEIKMETNKERMVPYG